MIQKSRDNAVSKNKDTKVKLDSYCLERKYDPLSGHNQIEDNWRSNNLYRGKHLGGSLMAQMRKK